LQIRTIGLYACERDRVDDPGADTTALVGEECTNGNAVVASTTTSSSSSSSSSSLPDINDVAVVPETLSKDESMRRRPLLLKIIIPVIKLLFSERASRRRSAMKILRTQRGLTRLDAIFLGIRYRRREGSGVVGLLSSISATVRILGADALRSAMIVAFRVGLTYPSRLIGAIANTTKRIAGLKVEPSLRE
jgi:hypothetical protein